MANENDFGMGYAVGRDNTGYGNGFGFGGDWLAILVILALLGGNGNWGFGGNGGNNMIGYELGKAATQADVASGFNNSAVLGNLNDLQLGQAGIQQTLCQGFNGVNQSIMQQGYNTQNGFNSISRQLAECCCDLRETSNRNTRRLFDYMQAKENQELRDQVLTYKFRESQAAQNAYLVDQIRPTARPAYLACNPYESAWGWNRSGNSCCNNG